MRIPQILRSSFLQFLGGAVTALSLAPFNITPLIIIGLGALYFSLHKQESTKHGVYIAASFSFGYFLIGLYWIANALFVYWEDYWWAYPFALLGLPLFFSGLWGGTAWLIMRFSAKETISRLILSIALFTTLEWIRGWIFTGFPWNLPGYAWNSFLPIAQSVSIGGMFFLTLLTFFWAFGAGALVSYYPKASRKRYPILLGLVLGLSFCVTALWGHQRLKNNPLEYDKDYAYLIVQPNIPQDKKWEPDLMISHIRKLETLSYYNPFVYEDLPTKKLFIIWPETAMAQSYFDHPSIKEELVDVMASWPIETEMLTGMLHIEENTPQPKYYNSVYYAGKDGKRISRYDKSHLVPFGEYIPLIPNTWLTPLIGIEGFEAGDIEEPIEVDQGKLIYPLICYEIIFPNHLKKRANNHQALAILTVTNDAWYGDSSGPYQHHAMSRFRAIEQGMPVIRSANTGISGAYDSFGRKINKNISYNKSGNMYLYSPKSLSEGTPFSKNGNNLFFSTLGILYFLFMVLKKKLY